MCDYKYNGTSCVVETHSVSKLCSFHETEVIFNEIKKQLDTILYERLPESGYRLRVQFDANQDIRQVKEFIEACQEVEKKYGRFYRDLDWANLEDYFYLFMCQKGSSLDTQNFYLPVKDKKIIFKSKKNQEDKNDNSNIWQRELILQNIKYYDFDKFNQLFDLNSYNSSKKTTYSDLYTFVYDNNYGSSELPNFIEFNNIIFNKDLTINLPEINIDFNNCKFNGNVSVIAKSIRIKDCSNEIDDKTNIKAIFRLIAEKGSILIFDSKFIKLNQINIQTNHLSIRDTVIENIFDNIDIDTSFYDLYLSNKLELNPLFQKTKVHVYDNSDKSYVSTIFNKDLTIQDTYYGNPIPQLKVPKEFLEFNSSGKGTLRNVDLRTVIFHNNSKAGNNYNPENLSKLNFVHCQFNEGYKLFEKEHELKYLEYNYRYLRKHYDEKGDYIEGNDFHYNYMEAKRKNTKNAWDAFLLGLYGIINGYNTKPERTLYWLFGMFLVFTFLIACIGNFSIKHAVDKDTYVQLTSFPDYCTKLGYSFSYNATNLMPILKSDRFIGIDGWSIGIGIFENISGVVLIALLVMALRNRFRRSKSEDEFK